MNENNEFRFVDCLDAPHQRSEVLEPIVIKKKVIDREIVRLANLPAPVNGRRMSLVCNPHSGIGNGLTPGIAVAICVLKPGEQTKPLRHNSSLVNFCIQGEGSTIIDGRRLSYHPFDVWTTPPWSTYQHFNDTRAVKFGFLIAIRRFSRSSECILWMKLRKWMRPEHRRLTKDQRTAQKSVRTERFD